MQLTAVGEHCQKKHQKDCYYLHGNYFLVFTNTADICKHVCSVVKGNVIFFIVTGHCYSVVLISIYIYDATVKI